MKTETLLFGKQEYERREIASLTKIMTCYVVLKLLQRFNLDETTTMVEVSENAADIAGTSAELVEGDTLSVWDLLHGLILPSGNDAAIALAEFFGEKLLEEKKDNETNIVQKPRRNIYLTRNTQFWEEAEICAFIEEMNKYAIELSLKSTFFDSPHGLTNWYNWSTALDLSKLCCLCMKSSKFASIVGTKHYKVPKREANSKSYHWENT